MTGASGTCMRCGEDCTQREPLVRFSCTRGQQCPATWYHQSCVHVSHFAGFPCPAGTGRQLGLPTCGGTVIRTHFRPPVSDKQKAKRVAAALLRATAASRAGTTALSPTPSSTPSSKSAERPAVVQNRVCGPPTAAKVVENVKSVKSVESVENVKSVTAAPSTFATSAAHVKNLKRAARRAAGTPSPSPPSAAAGQVDDASPPPSMMTLARYNDLIEGRVASNTGRRPIQVYDDDDDDDDDDYMYDDPYLAELIMLCSVR
jgi:hypothetical protein